MNLFKSCSTGLLFTIGLTAISIPAIGLTAQANASLAASADDMAKKPATAKLAVEERAFHVVFGFDPGPKKYDGIVGTRDDAWNFVKVGTKELPLVSAAGKKSTARLALSENNGCWGIVGHGGIFHAYLYHQNQAVDLSATIHDLPAGRYAIYVFAHGDAPDQNAKISVTVGERFVDAKPTLKDGSWDFRKLEFAEGVQYVKFEARIEPGQPLQIVSQRDGSNYSMFNAIQIVPWPSRLAAETDGKATPQPTP
jgi:hypothetical protein